MVPLLQTMECNAMSIADPTNRIRKAKRLVPTILIREIGQIHVHPMTKREPNPYDG